MKTQDMQKLALSCTQLELQLCVCVCVCVCVCAVAFRPDLVDYRQARHRSARQNLDMAFNIFEREFGVTRLLDAEGSVASFLVE